MPRRRTEAVEPMPVGLLTYNPADWPGEARDAAELDLDRTFGAAFMARVRSHMRWAAARRSWLESRGEWPPKRPRTGPFTTEKEIHHV
jgi:hypothetical protein